MEGEHSPAPDARTRVGIWDLGDVRIDETTATVTRAGEQQRLDRSGYDVLLALLRRRGEVVTKDELLEIGWPGRVVSENSLAKAVSRLRQLLGDQADRLRAVHGYGYRYTGEVSFRPSVEGSTPAMAPHPASGSPVPHRRGWTLGRTLANGATGSVFEATSPGQSPRAIKFAHGEAGLRAIKREAGLLRYVAHVAGPHAPTLPLLGWNLALPPFFLELPLQVDGHLAQWLRDDPSASTPARRLEAAVAVCRAVALLHDLGVVHRDLKPENLYLETRDGALSARVGDLGASDAAGSASVASLGLTLSLIDTLAGSPPAGSLLYIAPEIIGGAAATQHSDVYALGVLTYQLAVGDLRRPLAPGWEDAIDDALLREDIALAAHLDPMRRMIDARGLAERLASLPARRERDAAERAAAARTELERKALAAWRRRRRLGLVVTASLLLAVGTLAWQQQRTARAQARAEQALATARTQAERTAAVLRFMTHDVLGQANPFASARADEGATTLRQALDDAARTVDSRFARHPHAAAAVHGALATAYVGLNDFPSAVRHRRREVSLVQARGPDRARAESGLCLALTWLGDVARARRACGSALAAARMAGERGDEAVAFLGLLETREGRARSALRILDPLVAALRPGGPTAVLADALWFKAVAHAQLGDLVAYERDQRERVAVRQALDLGQGVSMDQAWALSDHGAALLAIGEESAGHARLEAARAAFLTRAGAGHPHAWVPRIRAARHLAATQRWRDALDVARPAYDALQAKVGLQNWTIYAGLVAMQAHADLGQGAQARALAAQLEPVTREPGSRYLIDDVASALASTHATLGAPDAAERWIGLLQLLQAGPADVSRTLPARIACLQAEAHLARGARERARVSAATCRDGLAATVPPRSPLHDWPRKLLAESG